MRSTPLAIASLTLLTALTLTVHAGPARAETDKCAATPKSKWLPADTIKSKAEQLGYTVRRVREEDGCWEVYAMASDGKKAELYFAPATGELVSKGKDD